MNTDEALRALYDATEDPSRRNAATQTIKFWRECQRRPGDKFMSFVTADEIEQVLTWGLQRARLVEVEIAETSESSE